MTERFLRTLMIVGAIAILMCFETVISAGAVNTWHSELMKRGESQLGGLIYSSSGEPRMLTLDYNSGTIYGKIKYSYKVGTEWKVDTLPDQVMKFQTPVLALGKNGTPAIVYIRDTDDAYYLCYAVRTGENVWVSEDVDSIKASQGTISDGYSLAFDQDGKPHISYIKYIKSQVESILYHASKDDANWDMKEIDHGNNFSDTSICINGNNPSIAFCAGKEGIQYAYRTEIPYYLKRYLGDSYWTLQSVASEEATGLYCRYSYITLRFAMGAPVICYNDEIDRSLNFAYALNGKWDTKVVRSSSGGKNFQGDSAKMEVIESDGACTIYLVHSDSTISATTKIQLEKLSITSSNGLKNPSFTTQTVYSGGFGNTYPLLISGQKNGTPTLAYFDPYGKKIYHVSMEPELKTDSSILSFGALEKNEQASKEITITNNGSMPLNITQIDVSSGPFSVENGDAGSLASGKSRVIKVSFEPIVGGVTYDGKITISSNDPSKPQYEVKLTGRSLGDSAELSSIALSNGMTVSSPSLESNTVNVVHATDSIKITPVANQDSAAVKVNDDTIESGAASEPISLRVGENTVTINVTSENGKADNTYTLTITRSDSPDARLSVLNVSQGVLSPEFSPEIYSYTMTLPNGASQFTLAPTSTKPKTAVNDSTIKINDITVTDSYLATADVGENEYTIKVTAPDSETTLNYNVTVFRLPELSGLELDHGTLNTSFSPYTTEYTATVTNGVKSICITPASNDRIEVKGNVVESGAQSNAIQLVVGENTIPVEVTSPDGEVSREYTLKVTRLPGLELISVGDSYFMVGNESSFNFRIMQAECPIYLEIPEGMRATISKNDGGTPVIPVDENGLTEDISFIEGDNGTYTVTLISPECEETTEYSLSIVRYPEITGMTVAGIVLEPEAEIPTLIAVNSSCENAEIEIGVNEGTTFRLEGNSGPQEVEGKINTWVVPNLRVGANYFDARLTAHDDTMMGYNFIILRPPVLSSITLSTGTLSPEFDPDVFRYTVDVEKEVSEITVSVECEDPTSTVTINGQNPSLSESVPLEYVSNSIPIVVSTPDGAESKYYLNVVHQGPTATISPTAISFDKYASAAGYADIIVTATEGENALVDIREGDAVLTNDIDYTSDGAYTIKKEYLSTLPTGQASLTFDYIYGAYPVLLVSVSDSTPGGSGTTSSKSAPSAHAPDITPPSTEDGATTVTAQLEPTMSGDTASADVPASAVNSAVKEAVDASVVGGTEPIVQLNIQTPSEAGRVAVSLTSESTETLANSGVGLMVTTGVGDVSFDAETLSSIIDGQEDKNVTLSIETVEPDSLNESQRALLGKSTEAVVVIDLNLTIGEKKVTDLGGTAVISIPCPDVSSAQADTMVVWFLADDGSITRCEGQYNEKNHKYEFKTNHFSAYALVSFPFTDVPDSAWYYGDVAYTYMNQLMEGTSAVAFTPDGATTRGMLVTILYRMEGQPTVNGANPFADVASGKYYTDAIIWATEKEIVDGYSEALFGPDDEITREQMATILYRYAAFKECDVTATADLSHFIDSGKISSFAETAMSWANAKGLITGKSSVSLEPRGNADRCQVAAILHRFCEMMKK